MAKYYVQSGAMRGIVDCYDSECAAVWVVNRVMNQIPILSEDDMYLEEVRNIRILS